MTFPFYLAKLLLNLKLSTDLLRDYRKIINGRSKNKRFYLLPLVFGQEHQDLVYASYVPLIIISCGVYR